MDDVYRYHMIPFMMPIDIISSRWAGKMFYGAFIREVDCVFEVIRKTIEIDWCYIIRGKIFHRDGEVLTAVPFVERLYDFVSMQGFPMSDSSPPGFSLFPQTYTPAGHFPMPIRINPDVVFSHPLVGRMKLSRTDKEHTKNCGLYCPIRGSLVIIYHKYVYYLGLFRDAERRLGDEVIIDAY